MFTKFINDKNKLNEIYLEQQRINSIKVNGILNLKMKAQSKKIKEDKQVVDNKLFLKNLFY